MDVWLFGWHIRHTWDGTECEVYGTGPHCSKCGQCKGSQIKDHSDHRFAHYKRKL